MHNKSILIIEDDDDIRETLKQVLELEGYQVLVAANGKEGLVELCRPNRPCLVILDLMMPIMNGWEFLSEKSKDDNLSRIPVVVISAALKLNSVETTQVVKALRKPIDLDSLVTAIKQHCAAVV
jgi:CheY-like chemotaxis protein